MKVLNALISAVDLLYPRNCIITGDPVEHEQFRYISEKGLEQLVITEPPACKTCGHAFEGEVEAPRQCPKCYLLKPVFNEGKTILAMNDAGRHLIHTIKYHNGLYLKRDISELARITKGFSSFLKGATLAPVPLHSLKLRQRGFNQSLLIAKAFKQASEGSYVEDCLSKLKDTGSQTVLDRKKRIANMSKAFALKRDHQVDNSKRYVVVDDVFTTGATLNACCRVLQKNGAKNIDIVSLGHG